MKKDKKSKNSKLLISLCSIVVIILSISFTYAWFLKSPSVNVTNDSNITCTVGNSLDIRLKKDDGTWTDWGKKQESIGGLPSLEDVSGNGLKLFSAEGFEEDKNNDTITPTSFSKAQKMDENGAGDYIELEVQIRSKSYIDIYYSENSFVNPLNPDKTGNVFGNFSPDYISAAMRVAVMERTSLDENTYRDTLKMIWSPNPEVNLSHENGKYTLDTNDKNPDNYEEFAYYCIPGEENLTYVDVPKETTKVNLNSQLPVQPELHYVSHEEFVNKRYVVGSTNSNNKMFNQSPLLTTLNPNIEEQLNEDRYAVSHLIFRIWFEGTDRESNQALSGGQVNMNISLIGNYTKPDCDQTYKDRVDAIKYNDQTKLFEGFTVDTVDNIYFSTNGYSWGKLMFLAGSDTNLPNMEDLLIKKRKDIYVYFKYAETLNSTEYIGKPIKFTYVESAMLGGDTYEK